MLGGPPSNFGFTISGAPTVLNALTTRECGSLRWICSPSESLKPTAKCGPVSSNRNGLVASITTLPSKAVTPALSITEEVAVPRVAITINSPNDATSAHDPTRAFGCSSIHDASFPGSRVPSITSSPRARKPAASD